MSSEIAGTASSVDKTALPVVEIMEIPGSSPVMKKQKSHETVHGFSKILELNKEFWDYFPYEAWVHIYRFAFPDTPTDYASNLVARLKSGKKVQMQLVDYYKVFYNKQVEERRKKFCEEYIRDIDKIFAPENRLIYVMAETWSGRCDEESSHMGEETWARRKKRNAKLAAKDLKICIDWLDNTYPDMIMKLKLEHERLVKNHEDIINQSLHCLIKQRPFREPKYSDKPYPTVMCEWRKNAHKEAGEEHSEWWENGEFRSVRHYRVLKGLPVRVPDKFAGKLCLVPDFANTSEWDRMIGKK